MISLFKACDREAEDALDRVVGFLQRVVNVLSGDLGVDETGDVAFELGILTILLMVAWKH